jgi:hypothetical protein
MKGKEEFYAEEFARHSFHRSDSDKKELNEWVSTKLRFLKNILNDILVNILQNFRLFKEEVLQRFLCLIQMGVFSFLRHKWNVKVTFLEKN